MTDKHNLLHKKHLKLKEELQDTNLRLSKKNALMMENNSVSKSKVRKLQRSLQKTNIRLAKKNAKMMSLNKVKNTHALELKDMASKIKDLEFLLKERESENARLSTIKSGDKILESHIQELSERIKLKELEAVDLNSKNKDLEFLLKERDSDVQRLNESLKEKDEVNARLLSLNSQIKDKEKEIFDVSSDVDAQRLELQKLQEEKAKVQKELDDMKKEVTKKDTIIDLLQKSEYDYKGMVTFNIERINAKWIGWPEGANLEEIDYVIVNNSDQILSGITMDVYIEDADNYHYKLENINIKAQLHPKERISRKFHMFKQLKKRGNYKVELKIYVDNRSKEVARDTKILVI